MEIPSYIKDIVHFLQTIEGIVVPKHAWLVAVDVEALFCRTRLMYKHIMRGNLLGV